MTAMPRTQAAHPAARAAPAAGAGAGARSGGYLLTIVINALLLYVVHHLVAWDVRFITPAWNDVLWAVDVLLQATIVANVLFLIYDARWFHSLLQVVPAGAAVLALWWMYQIFPFDFGSVGMNDLARLGLVMLTIAAAIGTLVAAVVGIVDLVRCVFEPAGAPE
jgi:hypothetical protein